MGGTPSNVQLSQLAPTAGCYAPVYLVSAFSTEVTTSPPSGVANIDGSDTGDGQRVLLTSQTHSQDNGIWLTNSTGAWTRPSDWSNGSIIPDGSIVPVAGGEFSGYLYNTTWQTSGLSTVGVIDPGLTLIVSRSIYYVPVPSSYPRVNSGIVETQGMSTNLLTSVTAPAVTSGTAFEPSTLVDSMVYFQINAPSSGSYTLTMGPSTGAEHTIASSVAMVAGSDVVVTLRVPATWQVVITLTTVTLASTTVVTG